MVVWYSAHRLSTMVQKQVNINWLLLLAKLRYGQVYYFAFKISINPVSAVSGAVSPYWMLTVTNGKVQWQSASSSSSSMGPVF